MANWYAAITVTFAAMVCAGFVRAQAPADTEYVPAIGGSAAPAAFRPILDALPYERSCMIDLVVGLPTGVRIQHNLGDGVGRNWLIEGFAGVELIFPMAGGGIRRRITISQTERDSFSISPGVDAYVLYNILRNAGWLGGGAAAAGLVTADVDLLWEHSVNERCASHLGVKLGAGYGFSRGQAALPVLGLVFGFSF